MLRPLHGYEQERFELSSARTAAAAAPSILRRYPSLARRVRGADLVHVHGDAATVLCLPLLARRPSVWTTHGLHLLRRRPAVGRAVRMAMARTRVTICTSQAEADELRGLAPELAGRLMVVPNGVPAIAEQDAAERELCRAELGLVDDEVAALFMGELESRKRPADALAAVHIARGRGAPLVLLIAGNGPLERELAAQGGGDGVRMLGYREDAERLLAAADVLVMPSEREGLSFALLEAMARGLAIVSSDGPGNAEAVGDAGVVVGVGDVDALADALTALALDRHRREALGAAARRRVQAEFTPDRLRAGVADVYEAALAAPTVARP